MSANILDRVHLDQAAPGNFFVRDRATSNLIGRVWQQPSGNWWAMFYLADTQSVSGGPHGTRDGAVVAVWNRFIGRQP
jgi:hypothetical protein